MAGDAHATSVPVTLGIQNSFLIRPVRIGGRRGVTAFDPGAQPQRVAEYAAMLPDHYDVWAANEVFAAADVDRLAAAWAERAAAPAAVVTGPSARPWRGQVTSSGVAAFVSGWSVVRVRRHRFDSAGRRRADADTWASKGVLLVGLRHRLGADWDLAITHLHAGGYVNGAPADADSVRRDQVDEMFDAVGRHRRAGVPLILCGDLNIDGGPAGGGGGDEDAHLRRAAATAGLVDAWDLVGTGAGYTSNCRDHLELFSPDPDDDRYCVEPASPSSELSRIDRCFVTDDDRISVASMRRRLHRRPADAPHLDTIATLSDHVGLDVELSVSIPATEGRGAP